MPLKASDYDFNLGLQAAIDYHDSIIKRCEAALRACNAPIDDNYKPDVQALHKVKSDHRMMSNDLMKMRRLSPEKIAAQAQEFS